MPEIQHIYLIELCSGELRRWQFLGPQAADDPLWRDAETDITFHESGLLYAWTLLGEAEDTDDG